ncbi:HlyD family secretion protein [Rhabdochromatium marinum]|uniref:HlyD family secretion protein n=1 Tax=Rhabdochromatium marinum TaxID=48729 RepID=UPI0019072852|nr:efflux RND transporter periplasmic adaptor subunit [Rhabdochromatium marinum]MBK1649998.1 hypothetical protein [Rhabdochromatium marinum]
MPQPPRSTNPAPRLRQDLLVSPHHDGDPEAGVQIQDPDTGDCYEFDAQTYKLLQAFDGTTSCAAIATSFNASFNTSLSTEDVEAFRDSALNSRLIEYPSHLSDQSATPTVAKHPAPSAINAAQQAEVKTQTESESELNATAVAETSEDSAAADTRWVLGNPTGFFTGLAHVLRPLRWAFLLGNWSLVFLVPLALYTLFDNQLQMSQDLARLGQSMSYFGRLVFSLVLINLLRCLVQGTLIAYYGGTVHSFGLRLRFGIIPRFFIDKRAIGDFNRSAQLWCWGSNLLFRLVLFSAATLGWYLLRDSGRSLAIHAIVVSHAALLTFLLLSVPLRPSDGYRWMMTLLRQPLSTLKLALMVLRARITGQPLPSSLRPAKARRLLLYALALITFWTWAFVRISSHIARGLIESFPNIFGAATEAIILVSVVLLMARWALKRIARTQGNAGREASATATATTSPLTRYLPRLLLLALVIAVLILPFPYRPGGAVILRTPEQQDIQAPISGQLIEVRYRGGDGTLIEAGATVAVMLSDELEGQLAALQEQLREQEAELAQRRARLAQTLAGTRPELITEARARVARAREEMTLASQQLETARITSGYSDRELERIHQLPAGIISELEVTRSEKQAAIDRQRIHEFETTVAARRQGLQEAAAQLTRLENGATKEEIEIARQEVAEAQAGLRQLQHRLDLTQSQLKGTQLRMPFSGFLVDAYLNKKRGRFLARGDTFARAQMRREPQVEMILPEAEIAGIDVGASAEIRLQAYPTRTFRGRVIAVEPTGSEAVFGRTFTVLIELLDTEPFVLKPGMSGYGKILSGDKPLYLQLSRPLTRFITIEMWSWIP